MAWRDVRFGLYLLAGPAALGSALLAAGAGEPVTMALSAIAAVCWFVLVGVEIGRRMRAQAERRDDR